MEFRTGDYPKYARFISETERKLAIPKDLLAVVLWQASQFDPVKISGAKQHPTVGVRGIAALTLAQAGEIWNDGDHRTEPYAAISGAGRLLCWYWWLFGSWRCAILAYHSGLEYVRDALQSNDRLPIDARRYVEQAAAVTAI